MGSPSPGLWVKIRWSSLPALYDRSRVGFVLQPAMRPPFTTSTPWLRIPVPGILIGILVLCAPARQAAAQGGAGEEPEAARRAVQGQEGRPEAPPKVTPEDRKRLLQKGIERRRAAAQLAQPQVPAAFRAFDKDGDGKFSPRELRTLRNHLAGERKEVVERRSAAPLRFPTPARAVEATARPQAARPQAAAAARSETVAITSTARLQRTRQDLGVSQDSVARSMEERRSAMAKALQERRSHKFKSHSSRREREAKRQQFITDLQAYRYIGRHKSPPLQLPHKSFRPETRQGVKRGKKRGSKYYNDLLRRVSRQGRRRGGGYGGYGKYQNF